MIPEAECIARSKWVLCWGEYNEIRECVPPTFIIADIWVLARSNKIAQFKMIIAITGQKVLETMKMLWRESYLNMMQGISSILYI